MKKAAIIFTILLVLGIIITYQLRDKKERVEVINYVPYTVSTADVKEIIDTTGEVSALNRVEIKPSVSGRVDKLLVNEGDTVRKGQVLAYLSSSDRVAILDAVRSNPNENIKDWENTYKATPVISPMNGKIILRNVVEGQTISTNDILYALADELIVLASVDESDIGKIKNGQRAEITLDAYKDVSINGKVFQILEEGKNVSNVITYYVKIRPEKTPAFFKSLMTANIDIIVKEQKDAAVIPWDSFSEDEQGNTYVLVGDNMQQSKHIITTGILDGDNVEVTSGLSKGDTILVRKRRYNISMTKEETKGFLSMGPGKRKTGKDILNNGQNKKA
ncbi:MAG: efflux RND transporter periplasmic adaptor subunit [Elusimicrobia bacterium]|jgi:macrolide-specific efflux system membrane fusion protein|nr:efflux RND transporter periplasmic adaptor subunit [Elusimicrobiota bacterium]